MFNAGTGRLPQRSLLQQRYIIDRRVGKGGMGAIYLAVDTKDGNRAVAIKEMSQSRLKSTAELHGAVARFQGEANMLQYLTHPNLPRVYDQFQERKRSYLVMDFIDGKTLLELLYERRGNPLPAVDVVQYALQLCDVLTYLHQRQPPIIFRDLKPSNIMVTDQGHVFLVDFGIARFFKSGQSQDTEALGTVGYAAPELYTGQTTPCSDLYSLGAVLHCCLTVRNPSKGSNAFVFAPIRQYNQYVPSELEQLIASLVQIDERLRPQSAGEVKRVLLDMRAGLATINLSNAGTPSLPPYILPASDPANATAQTQRATSPMPKPPIIEENWWERIDRWYGDITWPLFKWYRFACQPFVQQHISRLNILLPLWLRRVDNIANVAEQRAEAIAGAGKQHAKVIAEQGKQHAQAIANQGLQQAGSAVKSGLNKAKVHLSNPTLPARLNRFIRGYSPAWTPAFTLLSGAALTLSLALGLYTFSASHGSYPVAALFLSLFLLGVIITAMFVVADSRPRRTLLFTGLSIIISCLALRAGSSVQAQTATLLQHITFNTLLAGAVMLTAIVPFFRKPPPSYIYSGSAPITRLPKWIEHLCPFLAAIGSVLLFSAFGNGVKIFHLSLSSSIGNKLTGLPSSLPTLNQIVIGLLVLVTLIPTLRFRHEFGGWDRLVVFVSILACALLQFSFGYGMLEQLLPPGSSPLLINTIRLGTVGIAGCAALIAFGRIRRPPQPWDRIVTLICATSCAFLLLNWHLLPIPSEAPDLVRVVTSSQPALLIFGVASLVLFLRWISRAAFNGFDRGVIFLVAIASALLQFSFWYGQAQPLDLISINILFALGLTISAFVLLFRLASHEFSWLDRLTILGFVITSILLQYGGSSAISLTSEVTAGILPHPITYTLVIIISLSLLGLVTLLRLAKPFNWFDRVVVISAAIACSFLPLTREPQMLQVEHVIRHLTTQAAFNDVALFGFAGAIVASLTWLRSKRNRADQITLLSLTGGAAICLCLNYFEGFAIFLPGIPLLLTQGVILATQVERVNHGASSNITPHRVVGS